MAPSRGPQSGARKSDRTDPARKISTNEHGRTNTLTGEQDCGCDASWQQIGVLGENWDFRKSVRPLPCGGLNWELNEHRESRCVAQELTRPPDNSARNTTETPAEPIERVEYTKFLVFEGEVPTLGLRMHGLRCFGL